MRGFGISDALLSVASLLFNVDFLAFDVVFCPINYFGQLDLRLLGEGLIVVSRLESFLELSH